MLRQLAAGGLEPTRGMQHQGRDSSCAVRLGLQVLSEILGWMAKAVEEFTLAVFNVKALCDWMKVRRSTRTAKKHFEAQAVICMLG